MPVYFHTEDIAFRLKKSVQLKSWIKRVIKSEKKKTGNINFIFCSDEYLLTLNQKYLKREYYTDVITFNQSESTKTISGDIYISIDRVRENAVEHSKDDRPQTTEKELHRVMIHGVLHLLGYDDKKKNARDEMRRKEDECLKMM